MATARCYTKSGNKEVYEANLWQTPGYLNWSSSGIVGTITTPNSNGNYTVTPAKGYKDSNISTEFYCYTMYGNVKKTFYFTPSVTTITFKLSAISISGYINISCSTSHPLETSVTCIIERIAGSGIKCNYSLLYEKSNLYGGRQEFHVADKPSRDDIYTIMRVYPTSSENFKYEGYFFGIRVT
nr:MAG TPA: hypothetical protein [Caudoviricetes sp.]